MASTNNPSPHLDKDGNLATGSSGMEERLYSLNDANFNTTGLVTSGGVVAERFLYDSYGQVATANGTPVTPSADNAWIYLHQGGRWDSATGMYNFRNRDFSPTLMRWATNDPIGFGGGDTNTYRYVNNNPLRFNDPTGLIIPLISLVVIGGLGGANIWIWGKNFSVGDDLIRNRPIDIDKTPYSGDHWNGLKNSAATGSAIGLGVGTGGAFLPASVTTAGMTGLSLYGTYHFGSEAIDEFQNGNYASG